VDTSVIGEYIITYTATDLAGNSATAERIVNVTDPASSSLPEAEGTVSAEGAVSTDPPPVETSEQEIIEDG
ncbi:MAG: hypothetical protein G01um101470_582, partial [Parcubacteria group bacterium Gr01-1014_70]